MMSMLNADTTYRSGDAVRLDLVSSALFSEGDKRSLQIHKVGVVIEP